MLLALGLRDPLTPEKLPKLALASYLEEIAAE
jgi:hypothetical protein